MSRTAIAYRNLVKNGSLDCATGPTTIDSTLVTAGVTLADAKPERTLIRVANTHGSAHNLIVRAGDNPPALRAGQGDLTVEVALTSGVRTFGPFESDKYLQSDGSMEVDFSSGFTGTIDILLIPRG